jgi:hypothetical protein
MIFKFIARVIFIALVFMFFESSAQPNDTLGQNSFVQGFYHTSYIGLGSPTGNNIYGDQAKAQEFKAPDGWFVLSGVSVRFATIIDADTADTSQVIFRLCAMNGSGIGSNGLQLAAPGSVWQEVVMPLSSLDTGTWIQIPFATFAASEKFAVVMELSGLKSGDSISLYHSQPDNTISDDRSWERRSDGTWKTLRYSWPLDVDLAMIAVVETGTGIFEAEKITTPVFRRRQDILEWQNVSAVNTPLYVYDIQGKLLFTQTLNAGSGSLSLDPRWSDQILMVRTSETTVLLPPVFR